MMLVQSQVKPWYDDTGIVVAVIGILVTMVLGILALWAAFRSQNPRRNIYVYMETSASLLRTAGLGGDVEVRHRGQVLKSPYVATIKVTNRGTRDIARGHFDGRPLKVNLGVPIVALIDKLSKPGRTAVPDPTVNVVESSIEIGPALLTRSHELSYVALVDGRPHIAVIGELPDVEVRNTPPPLRPRWRAIFGVAGILYISATILGAFSLFKAAFHF